MSDFKRILIATYGESGYARDIVIGANRYAYEVGSWFMTHAIEGQWPLEVRWDGVLGCFGWRTNRDQVAGLLRATSHLVSVAQFLNDVPELIFIGQDNERIGALAAEHFLDRGFRHYAMLKDAGYWSTLLRAKGYRDRVSKDGFEVRESKATWADWRHPGRDAGRQGRWLRELPKPCALFCNSDGVAWQASISCHVVGIAVPDEVAILGVDDNELYTHAVTPALSSVRTNAERIGYEGARQLHALMRGEKPPREPRLIEPEGVMLRGSTDTIAIDDPELKAAVRFMRAHACEGIGVGDVVRAVALSRRTLEMKVRRVLGRTPRQELARQRLERAKELLLATDLKVADVARRTGFESLERFVTVFKRAAGLRPTDFRRRHRRPTGWAFDVAAAQPYGQPADH